MFKSIVYSNCLNANYTTISTNYRPILMCKPLHCMTRIQCPCHYCVWIDFNSIA